MKTTILPHFGVQNIDTSVLDAYTLQWDARDSLLRLRSTFEISDLYASLMRTWAALERQGVTEMPLCKCSDRVPSGLRVFTTHCAIRREDSPRGTCQEGVLESTATSTFSYGPLPWQVVVRKYETCLLVR